MNNQKIDELMRDLTDNDHADAELMERDGFRRSFGKLTESGARDVRARVRDLAASLNNTRRARLRSIHDCESVPWSKSPNVFRAMMAMGLIRRERHRMAWAFAEPLGRAVLRVLESEGA